MTMRRSILPILALLLAPAVLSAQQDTVARLMPRVLSYQGVLADLFGQPVPNGSYTVTLRLYDAATAGAMLWEETQSITTLDGVFDATLGLTTPMQLPFDRQYWLTTALQGEPEMSPRIALAASPYAFRSVRSAEAGGLAPGAYGAVTSLNGMEGGLTIEGGDGVTVTGGGSKITITALREVEEITSSDGSLVIANPRGPTVDLILGAIKLDRLVAGGASVGQVLIWDGTKWVPGRDSVGLSSIATTARLTGDGTATRPLDIAQQGAANGDVLKWNGSAWTPAGDDGLRSVAAGSPLAGTGTSGDPLRVIDGSVSGQLFFWNGTRWSLSPSDSPASGQMLVWNGSAWTPGDYVVATSPRLSGNGTPTNPIDIAQQGASAGQTMIWNGSAWGPADATVITDGSMQGNGTVGLPLGISHANANRWTVPQTFTTVIGDSLALSSRATSASTTAGDAGNTLVTKDFVTAPGNVAVGTDPSLTGNGTTASPLAINLSNTNSWSGAQTFATAIINGGAINATPIGGAAPSSGAFTTIDGASLSLSGRATSASTAAGDPGNTLVTKDFVTAGGNVAVGTNPTLTGNGTTATPLGINLSNANTWGANQTFTTATINGGAINSTPIGAATPSSGAFTTIVGATLSLSGKATSASTVAGDGGTTLVTKDFVTAPGNVAVTVNGTLTGNGTTGSPLGINLANSNTWTAGQTFTTINAGSLALSGKAVSASTVAGDAGTTLVTKDFVTAPGNVAVTTNATITGNGTTGSPIGINLSNANSWGANQTFTTATINGGAINATPIGSATPSSGAFTTINGGSLTLSGKATSASTTAGDGGTTLVTKDFVTSGGNVAVATNATITGNGTTGSPIGVNLSNPNSWTANQTFATATINGGAINATPIGSTTPSSGAFTTINGTSLALTAKATSASTVAADGGTTLVTKDFVTSGNIPITASGRLSGNGTAASPLDIAQQGATLGQAMTWNGTAWGPGAVPVSGTGGANQIAFWSGSSALTGSSRFTWDDNTRLFTIDGAFAQSARPAPALSQAAEGRLYFDATSNTFKVSQNGGAYVDLLSGAGWQLTGNSALSGQFIGTTNSITFEMRANNLPMLLLNPNGSVQRDSGGNARGIDAVDMQRQRSVATNVASGDYSTIGGGSDNTVSASFASVSGGYQNIGSRPYSTASGGRNNTASDTAATVAGGSSNKAQGIYSMVGGGAENLASGYYSTIGGGYQDTASNSLATIGGGSLNKATAFYSTVGGGSRNLAGNVGAAIAGGEDNQVWNMYGFIGGGNQNRAYTNNSVIGGGSNNIVFGNWGTVVGGLYNSVTSDVGFVGGGMYNIAGNGAAIVGGTRNKASNPWSFVGGGDTNIAAGTYSVVGGGRANKVTSTTNNATICGGDTNTASNTLVFIGGGYRNTASGYNSTLVAGFASIASGDFSFVGGGLTNTASNTRAIIVGGNSNVASGNGAIVVGGLFNLASGTDAFIGGGQSDTATGINAFIGGGFQNAALNSRATVAGGYNNSASGVTSSVLGGFRNVASGQSSFVGGGDADTASGANSVIGGGSKNKASGGSAVVGGGFNNVASGFGAFVGGGTSDTASGTSAFVGGGIANRGTGSYASIGGGNSNIASGTYATVPGGQNLTASGNNSTAMGTNASTGGFFGSFVYGDASAGTIVTNSRANQFAVRSQHIWLGTTSAVTSPATDFITTSTGAVLTVGGTWTNSSDRNRKTDVRQLNSRAVLQKVIEMPVTSWRYRSEPEAVRHIGPMAQDFQQAFGLSADSTHIATVDIDGVALASIQGLYGMIDERDREIARLRREVETMGEKVDRLTRIEELYRQLEGRLQKIESDTEK